jgi:2-keto-3-deoxy-L-fuconate dehydrogenase
VTSKPAITALENQIGPIDVLFNCAGYVHSGAILECDVEEWRLSFGLNVTSMYRLISAFIPRMIQRGGGSIINMASVDSPSLRQRISEQGVDESVVFQKFIDRQPMGRVGTSDEIAKLA